MKKSIIVCSALMAMAIATGHRAAAVGSYEITQLDASSGLPRGTAAFISDTGVAAGWVNDDDVQKAFVWTANSGLQLIAFGGSVATTTGISPNGIAIGVAQTAGNAETRGFLWTAANGVQEVEGLGGGYTFPSGVNSRGVVVGESETTGGERHAFMWTATGGAVDLGTPGSESRARFVSENGVIVVETTPATGGALFAVTPTGRIEIGRLGKDIVVYQMNRKGSVIGSYSRDDNTAGAFFWSIDAGLRDIGAVEASDVYPNALSENDIVAGFGETDNGVSVSFVWTLPGGAVTIPSLGGDRTFPTAVNSNGLVTGFSSTSKGRHHAFAWTQAGGTVDLGTLNGGAESFAQIVTESGTIVGTSEAPGKKERAFTWTVATGMVELPSLGGPFDAV